MNIWLFLIAILSFFLVIGTIECILELRHYDMIHISTFLVVSLSLLGDIICLIMYFLDKGILFR